MLRTDLRLSRHSFVSTLLASLLPARMTPIAGWVRSLWWTGFFAAPGLPAFA